VQVWTLGNEHTILGTEKKLASIKRYIGTLELPGCFVTETNHGSNVKGLETTATYNQNQTFTIHTRMKRHKRIYWKRSTRSHGYGIC
jgi:acyl-CoA oxidase